MLVEGELFPPALDVVRELVVVAPTISPMLDEDVLVVTGVAVTISVGEIRRPPTWFASEGVKPLSFSEYPLK